MVANGQYVNGHNMRFGTTDKGATGNLETIGGTDEIKNAFLFNSDNRGFGGCEDTERNRILFFNYNLQGNHGIFCFDKSASIIYKVLSNDQVATGLNFKKYIHSCGVANGCLYWTESDANEPRRIDIDAAIAANYPLYVTAAKPYIFPVAESVIRVIRRPPSLPPTVEKGLYANYFNPFFVSAPPAYATPPAYNKVKDRAFRFAWRFNYHTNETSVLSSFSELVNKNAVADNNDTIRITLPITEITQDVKTVDIVAQDADNNDCYIIYTWDVTKPLFSGFSISPIYSQSYFFTNHQTGEKIDEATAVKQFDAVPNYPETMEIAKDRLKLGNYITGQDTPANNSLKCRVILNSNTSTASYKNYSVRGWYYKTTTGYLALTEYKYVVLEILGIPASGYYKLGTGDIPSTIGPLNDSFTNFTYIGGAGTLQTQILAQINAAAPSGYSFVVYQWGGFTDNADITLTDVPYVIAPTAPQFKTGGIYETGVFFTDDYSRRCGVYRSSRIAIPDRKFADASVGGNAVLWQLSNTSSAGEIISVSVASTGITSADQGFSPGSGYVPGIYQGVAIAGNTGSGASVDIIVGAIGTVISVTVRIGGVGYSKTPDDPLTGYPKPDAFVNNSLIGGSGFGFAFSILSVKEHEIPEWATNVHLVLTKCLYTRSFIQGKPAANESAPAYTRVTYVKKDDDGAIVYTDNFPGGSTEREGYVAIDISCLSSYGIGYSFQPNDKMKLYVDVLDEFIDLDILGQDGKYVWCSLTRVDYVSTITAVSGAGLLVNGTYTNVPVIGGTGTGLTVDAIVTGGNITTLTINKKGIGYALENTLLVPGIPASGGGSGAINITGVTRIKNTLFEIYSPYNNSLNEPFYEVARSFKILNPGTSARAYSQLSGTFAGDTYILKRKGESLADYYAEAMAPNDRYWKAWNTSASRPNYIDKIGKQRSNAICFSDVYVKGTKINGLSSFSALNKVSIPGEYGFLRKLKLTKKVQADGTVMLAICTNETASIYLGEAELLDTQGSAYVAKADNVLGNIKALAGSMGTSHPESVFEYNGFVVWYDKRNACFVRYSNNGLFPISKNKLTRVVNLLSNDILDDQLVIGGCDPYHREFLFTIPKTLEVPPKGFLEDYDSVPYPYDVYDGRSKTLVYKSDFDYWGAPFNFSAETFIRLGDDLYSINEGNLYLHNTASDKIYGKEYTSGVAIPVNLMQGPKSFAGIALESTVAPSFVHVRTEDPIVQSSDLVSEDFVNKEGVIYAPLFRDRLDVNAGSQFFDRQMKGQKMHGKCLLIYLTFDKKATLKSASTNFILKEGHFTNT